jgi:ribonuclease III
MGPVAELESRLGYEFRNRQYLIRALTHRSLISETLPLSQTSDNEQLEFLGDAVLGFVVSESLFQGNPSAREGVLSSLKSHLVSSTHLHQCACVLSLGQYLLLGKGEERNGGRERKSLLANALEAVIAAIFLDGGIEPAQEFVRTHVLIPIDTTEAIESIAQLNYKSTLQERAQALGLPLPHYVTVKASGPEHAKQFTVEARVGDEYAARASASSKKTASQLAAQLLLDELPGGEKRRDSPLPVNGTPGE